MACEFKAHHVHVSETWKRRHGEERVVGKVTVHCRRALTRHTLEITLQWKSDGGWQDMATEEDNRVPPAGGKPLKPDPIAIYIGCHTGMWRSQVMATAVYQGETYRSSTRYSPPAQVECET